MIIQCSVTNMNLEQNTQAIANFLKTIGNPIRLMILCVLAERGEMCVTHLHEQLELSISQPALSQHLAKMRNEGILSFRQSTQKLYYKISDNKTLQIMQALKEIFCPDTEENNEFTHHQSN